MKERKKLHSTTDVDDDDVDDGTFQVDKGVVFHSQFNLLHVSQCLTDKFYCIKNGRHIVCIIDSSQTIMMKMKKKEKKKFF